jgi:hypothetical protein
MKAIGIIIIILALAVALVLPGIALAVVDTDVEGVLEDFEQEQKVSGHVHLGRGPVDWALDKSGYDALREKANEKLGLDWLIAYSVLAQRRSHSGNKKSDFNSELDFAGEWELIKSKTFGTTSFTWLYSKIWNHYTDANSSKKVSKAGGTVFQISDSDAIDAWRNIFISQSLFDNLIAVHAGQIDATAFFNTISVADNDRDKFVSQAFVRDPVRSTTDAFGLGATVEVNPTDWLYLRAGFIDGNSSLDRPKWDTFEKGDYIYLGEIGLMADVDGMGKGVYRVSPFYAENGELGKTGEGITFSFEQELPIDATVFGRASAANRRRTDLEAFLGGGIVFTNPFGFDRDRIGIAVGAGVPSDDEQRNYTYLVDSYWRMQLTERMEFGPSFQAHIKPAADRDRDVLFVGGLRCMWKF